MEKFNKNIDGIRNVLKDLKAEKYAIVNSELVALDEYIKGLYLKVLCTVIQYENDPSEMQILYLKRIVKGISIDDTAEECMRKALEISAEDMQEFLSNMGKSNCKYYFAVDGIILSSLGKRNAPGYDYLAEILELLEINKADLEYICTITKSVLHQDSSFYDQAKKMVNERVEKLDFAPYIQNYYAGAIIDTDIEKHYFSPDKKSSNLIEYPNIFKEKKVVFENIILNIDEGWKFVGCQEVIFKKCIINGKRIPISLKNIGKIEMDECKVIGFTNRIANGVCVNNISISNSEFIECGYTESDYYARGGMIWISGDKINQIIIKNNRLLNCYIVTKKSDGGVSGIMFGLDSKYANSIIMIENEFIGCECTVGRFYRPAIIGTCNFSEIKVRDNKMTGMEMRLFEDIDNSKLTQL